MPSFCKSVILRKLGAPVTTTVQYNLLAHAHYVESFISFNLTSCDETH